MRKEQRMKIISTRTHGVLDYLTAAALLAVPRALGWDRVVTRMMSAAALSTIGYSALTSYEFSLLKLVPMPAHLALDSLSAALFCGGPLLFPDEDSGVRRALVGIGVFELTVTLLSDSQPSWSKRQLTVAV
jgi:hypothetical protein